MNQITENYLQTIVSYLVQITEAAAVFVIFSGVIISFAIFSVRSLFLRNLDSTNKVRFSLGRFLAVGLEFQLASDLLRTAVAPSFEEIGKLAAVAGSEPR